MSYKVKTGERGVHGIQMAQTIFVGGPWANIFVDCMGTCEPQQSIGLKFDSNAEVDAFTDAEADAVFLAHGWTRRAADLKGWLCPACQGASHE